MPTPKFKTNTQKARVWVICTPKQYVRDFLVLVEFGNMGSDVGQTQTNLKSLQIIL